MLKEYHVAAGDPKVGESKKYRTATRVSDRARWLWAHLRTPPTRSRDLTSSLDDQHDIQTPKTLRWRRSQAVSEHARRARARLGGGLARRAAALRAHPELYVLMELEIAIGLEGNRANELRNDEREGVQRGAHGRARE